MASNYIPGSLNISNYNGKVGIGTLNPSQSLDVNGNISAKQKLLVGTGALNHTLAVYGDIYATNGLDINNVITADPVNGITTCVGNLQVLGNSLFSSIFANNINGFNYINQDIINAVPDQTYEAGSAMRGIVAVAAGSTYTTINSSIINPTVYFNANIQFLSQVPTRPISYYNLQNGSATVYYTSSIVTPFYLNWIVIN